MLRILLILLTLWPSASALYAQFYDANPVVWNGEAPSAYPVHGVDVARYQGAPDWNQLRNSGVNFAYIKATEGSDVLDASFTYNWQAAAQAGVLRGAYHFYYFCASPEAQAAWFIQNVPRVAGSLPPVIDLEYNHVSPTCTYRPPPAEARDVAQRFMAILTQYYGQRPLIYTNTTFYRENELWRLSGEEFWLRTTAQVPATAFPNQRWVFWQYTATARIDGVVGNIDANVFAGTEKGWQDWFAQRMVR